MSREASGKLPSFCNDVATPNNAAGAGTALSQISEDDPPFHDASERRRAGLVFEEPPRAFTEPLSLPLVARMNRTAKNHFVATIGEFIGTTLFLFFAFAGTQVANTKPEDGTSKSGFNLAVLLYISLCFGFSLMVNVWIFYRISGGLFNPAVTLAMVLVGGLPLIRAGLLFIAQLVGGIFASFLASVMFPTGLNVTTSLGGGASLVQGVFIEAMLTGELVFTIFMLAKEKHKATFIAPVGIGLALFIAELAGVYWTGGSLNPARSFGPCVVNRDFNYEHWIYWVGPFFGAIVAAFLYKMMKVLEYEVANPGQDISRMSTFRRSSTLPMSLGRRAAK
ncbi:MAG: hypothetical protein M1827_002938 [Pycnora praestabilis]|nr:MAG: hypothetical protein M1827_002938 [Pycnora praestabilis]